MTRTLFFPNQTRHGRPTQLSMTYPQMLRRQVCVNGHVYRMRPLESRIVATLLMRRGSFVSYEDLISACWPNPDDEPEIDPLNTIQATVCRLEPVIREAITTRWGQGFIIYND